LFLHFPCKEFAEESGKTGLRADTPFLPAYHFTQSAAVCQRRIALWGKKIFRKSCGSCRAGRGAPAGNTSLRPWQLTNTVGGHPVRWRVGDKAGGAAAPWLPLWGSWHGVAVTERVPCSNHGTFLEFTTACALSGSLTARQLSQRESQGAGFARPPSATTRYRTG